MAVAVVDAGPLIAAADEADPDHARVLPVFRRGDLQFVVSALAIAEAAYFVGGRLGASAEAGLFRGLAEYEIAPPTPDDCLRIAELIERYADFPLGGADASVVAIAERLQARIIVTLDRRHFAAIEPRHRDSFELLPER